MRALVTLIVVSSLALTAVLAAQDTGQGRPPTFRSSTRLVQLSVVVHDNRRRPVDGLTASDFRVFEDGREVPVEFFLARGAGTPAADPATPDPLGPVVFTNRLASPTEGGLVAILDQLNTIPAHQELARASLLRYLDTVRPEDRIALYVLSHTGLRVLYDFSRDAATLRRALSAVRPTTGTIAPSGPDKIDPFLLEDMTAFEKGVRRDEAFFSMRRRGEVSLEALEAVADRLSGFQGRKNLVWMSSGFPFILPSGGFRSNNYMTWPTRRAARALADADVVVYAVDPRGLMAGTPQRLAPGLNEVQEAIEGLHAVTAWTGGRLIYNTNDIAGAVGQAVADSRLTYVLGYYSSNPKQDGRFREVRVKVNRRGVEVRHRPGYYAQPLNAQPTPDAPAVLQSAVASPLEATGMILTLRAEKRPEPRAVQLTIRIEPGSVPLAESGDNWTASLDLTTAQATAGSAFSMDTTQRIDLSLDPREAQAALATGLRLTTTVELQDATNQLKVLLRDVRTGLLGSVIIEVEALHRSFRDFSLQP